jgi:hypothetical protein
MYKRLTACKHCTANIPSSTRLHSDARRVIAPQKSEPITPRYTAHARQETPDPDDTPRRAVGCVDGTQDTGPRLNGGASSGARSRTLRDRRHCTPHRLSMQPPLELTQAPTALRHRRPARTANGNEPEPEKRRRGERVGE